MATIIGIDLGKCKGVACTFTPESREADSSKSPPTPAGGTQKQPLTSATLRR